MMKLKPLCQAVALAAVMLGPCSAAVRLPAILSDHMVLQRAAQVRVWGWADPREAVKVELGGQQRATEADADGRWSLTLDTTTLPARPLAMTVRGRDNTLTVADVLIGEVWLASGQSNMQKTLGEERGMKPAFNHQQEIAAANYPQMRLFMVPKRRASQPADDVKGSWVLCSPESFEAVKFSAAGYYFGRRLHQALQVPVGVIASAYGGTRIEPWTEAGAATTSVPPDPLAKADDGKQAPAPSGLYNAMIAPLTPLTIRGVIWYQGESNVASAEPMALYTTKMDDLVRGWRQQWQAPLPFYYVQVAPHSYSTVRKARVDSPTTLPELWEAQADAQRIPGTGMIVTTDLVDDVRDIHPRDKTQVGLRLANLALRHTYGQAGPEVHSPAYRTLQVHGATLVLQFDHAAGLRTRDGQPPSHFELAGADGVYHPAQAVLRGEQVVLSSAVVAAPVAARFAWHEDAQPNLVNGAGLPAVPFRTLRPAR